MVPSPIAGSIEFHRVAWNSRWKAADNAETDRRFLMEPSPVTRIFVGHQRLVSPADREMNQIGVQIIDQITEGAVALIDVLDRVRSAAERALRQHRCHERIEVAVEHVRRRRRSRRRCADPSPSDRAAARRIGSGGPSRCRSWPPARPRPSPRASSTRCRRAARAACPRPGRGSCAVSAPAGTPPRRRSECG